MIILSGELSIKIKSVYSDKWFVRPCVHSFVNSDTNSETPTNDLSMKTENGEFLHICGANDWAFLALELLEPIKNEAKNIIMSIQERKIENSKIKAIVLGKNDKRIMDVYFGGKGRCNRILDLPVIESDVLDEVKFLVEDTYLPFS